MITAKQPLWGSGTHLTIQACWENDFKAIPSGFLRLQQFIVHGDPHLCLQHTLLNTSCQKILLWEGGKKRREWPDKRFNNISLSLGCFNLMQDQNAGWTRLGSSLSSPAPTLSIHLHGATFPNREPSPTGLSRQRSCRSSQCTLTTPLFAENCSPITYLGYIATASPEQRAAILLPALDCSILPPYT